MADYAGELSRTVAELDEAVAHVEKVYLRMPVGWQRQVVGGLLDGLRHELAQAMPGLESIGVVEPTPSGA